MLDSHVPWPGEGATGVGEDESRMSGSHRRAEGRCLSGNAEARASLTCQDGARAGVTRRRGFDMNQAARKQIEDEAVSEGDKRETTAP